MSYETRRDVGRDIIFELYGELPRYPILSQKTRHHYYMMKHGKMTISAFRNKITELIDQGELIDGARNMANASNLKEIHLRKIVSVQVNETDTVTIEAEAVVWRGAYDERWSERTAEKQYHGAMFVVDNILSDELVKLGKINELSKAKMEHENVYGL